MAERFENEKWSVQLDVTGKGKVLRNGEVVKNARAIDIRCEVGKIPQVIVTLNASDVAIELDGAGSQLGIGPSLAEIVGIDETVARLRATLMRLHERAGCGDRPGTAPDVCGICKDLVETAP